MSDAKPPRELNLLLPSDAYLMGLMQTDGHLENATGKGRARIELNVRDRSVLDQLSGCLPWFRPVRLRSRPTNFSSMSTTAQLETFDLAFRRQLERLGCPAGRKSVDVAPPAVEMSVRDYFRGLLDGDGSLGVTARGHLFVSFVTQSPQLADFVADVMLRVAGAKRTVTFNKRDGAANIMVANGAAQKLASWAYRPGDISIPRKAAAALSFRDWRPSRASSPRVPWTAADEALVVEHTVAVASRLTGRTPSSVVARRAYLRRRAAESLRPCT